MTSAAIVTKTKSSTDTAARSTSKIAGTTNSLVSVLTFLPTLLIRVLLMPMRLTPSHWTAVQLHFSPRALSKPKSAASTSPSQDAGVPPLIANLADLVQRTCPSLHKGHFSPNPLLPSGHLQTIYSAAANTVDIDVVQYKRRTILVPDGGTITIDITPPELADDDDAEIPTIITLHGLTGGSHESYVRNGLSVLAKPRDQGGDGYRGVVVNFRGCANTPVTSPQLYSASKTSDLRCAILFATRAWPKAPLVGIGFSLGANVLAKYMGEEGDLTPLRAGMPMGTPWDLLLGSRALESGIFSATVYSRVMSGNLTKVISRHIATLNLDPTLRDPIHALLDPPPRAENEANRDGVRPRTLRYVDDTMTRLGGGHRTPYGEFPFKKADDYYTHGGAVHFMHTVRRPMLVLNADDDPIVPVHILEGVRDAMGLQGESLAQGAGNGNIVLAVTHGGGHLGWWQTDSSSKFYSPRPRRWLREPVGEFVRAMFSKEATEAGLGAVYERNSPWLQDGRVQERTVEVQLLPSGALPSYEAQIGGVQEVEEEEAVVGHGASRVAWLRTKVLKDAPLVHPSHAPKGWKEPKAEEVETFESIMRPEVGFLELAPSTLVAGTGDTFQGGKGIPGEENGHQSGKSRKDRGLVAGL